MSGKEWVRQGQLVHKIERQILQEVADGMTDREIAAKRDTTYGSVKYHVENACTKLGAKNRTHAVCIALRQQLIK